MEEEAKPVRQPQRRLNPHIQEVVRAEVLKLLQASIIYPISDNPWLNVVTRKNHFLLPFIDEVLERVSGHPFYCFLDGYSGIVLGHIISSQGIEVDKEKVKLIVKLPSPTTVKGVRQFLGHAGFYRRFIKDFSILARPLCELLVKDAKFVWDDRCQWSFEELNDFAIGFVLGQREDGKPYVIYYASKMLNEAQRNYTTTEKELLAVVFALDKFRVYLIKDKKRVENVVADHLSRLAIAHNSHSLPINDDFPKESLMLIEVAPWKCFHTIDRHRLIPFFKEEIDDPKFFYSIHKVFFVGRLVGGEKGPYSVPHSILLSALPGNIYLHKLDQEIGRIRQKYEIPIVQRIRSVLLRAGRIDDQENSGKEASFNTPQDKRVIIVGRVKSIQRKAAFHSLVSSWHNPPSPPPPPPPNKYPPAQGGPENAFLNKPSSLLYVAFLIEAAKLTPKAEFYGRERCNKNWAMRDLIRYCKRMGLLIKLGGEAIWWAIWEGPACSMTLVG
ncbi:Retrovirus-related Pol polyprotein from transposon 17.6 [Vitis vinifera]|uniref:Retrovirus-related Pol polyprotein from transposon 17.6 n=1 Tax=Vitis vinifera TaxID=29760 RepID=A0A438GJH2_VITVI|nr:Retrovirus-related Pol polyprotein from transposon 17.6 [Vitis vinifera]